MRERNLCGFPALGRHISAVLSLRMQLHWDIPLMHNSHIACSASVLLCVFECNEEEPKITHTGRNVTMETRRQFSLVWPVLTELL